jgi:phosphohistidine phosphatase
MARELMLLRHGKSDWSVGSERDFHRPLAKRGTKAASRIGRWMKEQGLQPDCVLSSPAVRARDTTLRVCKKLEMSEDDVLWDGRLYGADVADLLEVLAACPRTAGRILVVGHNPGLEDLVGYLCRGMLPARAAGKLLPTAALARIAMPREWSDLGTGSGRCLRIVRPRDLEPEA